MTTPQNTYPSMPATANAAPASPPCTMPITNVPLIVARVTGPQVMAGSTAEEESASDAASPVHPLLWTLLGVFVLAAVGAAGARAKIRRFLYDLGRTEGEHYLFVA